MTERALGGKCAPSGSHVCGLSLPAMLANYCSRSFERSPRSGVNHAAERILEKTFRKIGQRALTFRALSQQRTQNSLERVSTMIIWMHKGEDLQPSFSVDRNIKLPGAPGMEVLPAELSVGHFVPHATAIVTDFDPLRPSATAIGPPSHLDLAVVYDDVLVDWRHDCARYRHSLDAEAVTVRSIVLADLGRIVKVLLHLDGRHGRVADNIDPCEPLDTPGANVAHDNNTKGRSVDSGKRLAVHLPY